MCSESFFLVFFANLTDLDLCFVDRDLSKSKFRTNFTAVWVLVFQKYHTDTGHLFYLVQLGQFAEPSRYDITYTSDMAEGSKYSCCTNVIGWVSKCPDIIWVSLRDKCPNTVFFLVRMRENTDQKKFRIWTLFTQCFYL